MAASNINRVDHHREPDRRSRAALAAERHVRLQAARRVQHAPQGQRDRRVGRQAQLLRRDRLGRAGRELRALPRPRAAASRSTAAWSGASGRAQDGSKRQAIDIIADTVQFLGGPREDARRRQRRRLHAAVRRPGRHERLRGRARGRRLGARPGRGRHPVLGTSARTPAPCGLRAPQPRSGGASVRVAALRTDNGDPRLHCVLRAPSGARFSRRRTSKDSPWQSSARSQARTPARQEGRARQRPPQALPVLQGQDRARRLQGRRDAARFISERGKIRSRRITGACRRHQSQIANAVKRARELALLPYVAEPPRRARRARRRRDRDRDREDR